MLLLLACSPEAGRERDGGPGADPGNKVLVRVATPNPTAADTTLWPGRNPTPVERLARGEMPPPKPASASQAPGRTSARPVTPDVPPTAAQQQTYERGSSANPRRHSGTGEQDREGGAARRDAARRTGHPPARPW